MMPDKGCFMLEVGPLPGLYSIVHGLDSEDVIEIPDHFHVTLLYGITEPVAPPQAPAWWRLSHTFGWIKKSCANTLPIDRGPTLFQNDEFDVLKLDAYQGKLPLMHEEIRNNFETDVDFDYHPHMTVAYLEPGTGEKYLDQTVGVDWLDVVGVSYNGPECKKRITKSFAEI